MAQDQKNSESLPVNVEYPMPNNASTPRINCVENIVLVGHRGNGKSATGNSIAGRRIFVSEPHAKGAPMHCKSVMVETPEGPILNVIDTPGLLEMTSSADFISREIIRCLHLAQGGFHAVLFVLSVRNRIKKEDVDLSTLEVLFGSKIVDYLIVVFTGGDELEYDGVTAEEYLEDCPDFLKRLFVLCDQRKVVFDNRTEDEEKKKKQVHHLLEAIDRVKEHNNYKPYTYHMIKEQNDRHKQEHEELEKEFEELKKELMLKNEQNLKAVTEMMEENMRMALDAQQKLFEHRKKAEDDRHHAEEQKYHKEMQDA